MSDDRVRITLRLTPSLIARIDRYRTTRQAPWLSPPTRNDAIVDLLTTGLLPHLDVAPATP